MVKPLHEPGAVVDGFRLEELAHQRRHGVAVARFACGHDHAHADEGAENRRRRRSCGGRQFRNGTDDRAAAFRRARGEIHRGRRFCDAALHRHSNGSPARPCSRGSPNFLCLTRTWRRIGVKIAQALDDLHRQHVVHLDIKPSNIMFRPSGEAVLLDFGLSHHDQLPDLMQEEFRLPFGTAPYMSPEQLRGIRNDPRSDHFRIGRAALFLFDRRAALRRKRDAARHAPAALARPGPAAPIAARLSALAAGDRAALPRDRAWLALPDGGATRVRPDPPERGQADRPLRTLAGAIRSPPCCGADSTRT